MNTGSNQVPSRLGPSPEYSLAPLVAVLFGLIVLWHIGSAAHGKSLMRPSHLSAALEYAHGRIDLLKPVITGFNATETPTVLELPLWQAAVASVLKLADSNWYGWANLVSLLLFATGLWPLFQLGKTFVGERATWWSLAFFLTQPLIIVMAGKAAVDGFCLVLTVWFLFFANKMIASGRLIWWLPTAAFACLSAVSKAPFFMAAGLCAVAILAVTNPRSWRSWLLLSSTGLAAVAAFLVWTRYCDAMAAQAVYPYLELRVAKSPRLFFWYFGDLWMRLNPAVWVKGGWRFLHATLGTLPFVALLLLALLRSGGRLAKLWLLATFLTTLVFANVVLVHWHYYLMCCPPVALLCGLTLARWEPVFVREIPWHPLRLTAVGILLVLSAIEGLIAMKLGIDYDYFPQQMSVLLREYTKPEDKLLIYKCDPEWPGEVLFRSARKGLVVEKLESSPDSPTVKGLLELLDREQDLQRLKSLGYTKLVLISEPPVRFAVVAANPGSHRERIYYPNSISPRVDAWATIYRSEDLLIKEIQ